VNQIHFFMTVNKRRADHKRTARYVCFLKLRHSSRSSFYFYCTFIEIAWMILLACL